jgi:hypothetical protein
MQRHTPLPFLLFGLILTTLLSCQNEAINSGTNPSSEKADPKKESSEALLDFSNPAVFLGTDFGNFIRSLYGIGDFEQMLQFTSSETIERFGKDQLRNHYQELDLRMEMRLLSTTSEDSLILLHYECFDKATKTVRRLPLIVENDSVKIHLEQLIEGTLFLKNTP